MTDLMISHARHPLEPFTMDTGPLAPIGRISRLRKERFIWSQQSRELSRKVLVSDVDTVGRSE